jgi:hypothetical protein
MNHTGNTLDSGESHGVLVGTIYRTHQAGICFGDADAEMPRTPNCAGMSRLPSCGGGVGEHGEEGGCVAG